MNSVSHKEKSCKHFRVSNDISEVASDKIEQVQNDRNIQTARYISVTLSFAYRNIKINSITQWQLATTRKNDGNLGSPISSS